MSNLNPQIIQHIAEKISDLELELVAERKDKFLSSLFKVRIEEKLMQNKPNSKRKDTKIFKKIQ